MINSKTTITATRPHPSTYPIYNGLVPDFTAYAESLLNKRRDFNRIIKLKGLCIDKLMRDNRKIILYEN